MSGASGDGAGCPDPVPRHFWENCTALPRHADCNGQRTRRCCLATTLPVRIDDAGGAKACRTHRIMSSVCFPLPATRQRRLEALLFRRRIPPVHGLQGVFRWIKHGDGQRYQENRVGDCCHIRGRRHRRNAPGVVQRRARQLTRCSHRRCRRRCLLAGGPSHQLDPTFDGSSTNATRRSLTSRGSPVTCTPFCFSSAIFASISAPASRDD